MQTPSEIYVEIIFERREGNRYYIHSPHIRGLHLSGPKLEELNALLGTAIKDLLYHNSDIVIDGIRWVPSLDDVVKQIGGAPADQPSVEKKTYVMNVQRAA